jgi:hypothetical protein
MLAEKTNKKIKQKRKNNVGNINCVVQLTLGMALY